jgi:hypothetical protein
MVSLFEADVSDWTSITYGCLYRIVNIGDFIHGGNLT